MQCLSHSVVLVRHLLGLLVSVAAIVSAEPVQAELTLLVGSFSSDAVQRYDGLTGAFIEELVAPGSGGLDGPVSVATGRDGNLYVSSFLTDEVLRYNLATGGFIDAFIPTGSGGLDGPVGLVFGPDGDLYVSSGFSNSILRMTGQPVRL